jgi:hypothetical protein
MLGVALTLLTRAILVAASLVLSLPVLADGPAGFGVCVDGYRLYPSEVPGAHPPRFLEAAHPAGANLGATGFVQALGTAAMAMDAFRLSPCRLKALVPSYSAMPTLPPQR